MPSDLYGYIQNMLPSVIITNLSDEDSFNADDAITISADASDSDGEVTLVQFYADGTRIGEDSTAPYSIIWENAAAGNYIITAKATDDKNAVRTSKAVSITVNPVEENIPPTVKISSPDNHTAFEEAIETIAITADASDSDGSITLVEFYANGSKISEDSTSPYELTWFDFSTGAYEITATATDNENATTVSSSITIRVTDGNIIYEEITAPFSIDIPGDFYWKTTGSANYINSWNLDLLEINGVELTNTWKNSADLPPKQDGYYYIHYKGLFNWSHFEFK